MQRGLFIIFGLTLVVSLLVTTGCNNVNQEPEPGRDGNVSPTTGKSAFNMIFKYGVMAVNELNTFEGTYTKDMVSVPSITVELTLSQEEKGRIYQKMLEIDFFNYPEEFSVSVPEGEVIGMVTPYLSYYFKVEYNSQTKELRWKDNITKPDEKADKLRELITLIRDIVESKEEYKKLPEPTLAYL